MKKQKILTDKEIKDIQSAANIVKNLAKYVADVNSTNKYLKQNLDTAIKAGDVTNEQKVQLREYSEAEKQYHQRLTALKEDCQKKCPGCTCPNEKHDTCELYHKFIVLTWMNDAAHGSKFGWDWISEYALYGRKHWAKKHILPANFNEW